MIAKLWSYTNSRVPIPIVGDQTPKCSSLFLQTMQIVRSVAFSTEIATQFKQEVE